MPAYGKRLLDEFRAGKYPDSLSLTLVYGDDWWAGRAPRLCIKPDDYERGKFDFRMAAGLRVDVIDQVGAALEADGKFFELLVEVARFAALVWIEWPKAFGRPAMELSEFAYARHVQAGGPRWWLEDAERAYRARFDGWFADLMTVNQSPIEERGRA